MTGGTHARFSRIGIRVNNAEIDELKVCVRSPCEEGRVPPPSRDDNAESADQRSALECAAAGCSPDEHYVSIHDWSTVGPHVSARPVSGHALLDWGWGASAIRSSTKSVSGRGVRALRRGSDWRYRMPIARSRPPNFHTAR